MSENAIPNEKATLNNGSSVALSSYKKGFLALQTEKPFPPGTPVTMRWREHEISGRSIGSKKNADGVFDCQLRMVNLNKEQLTLLETHLGSDT